MHLLELAVQNVRGFTPAGRHPLKLGYVVLRGPDTEPVAIATLALALLYPDGRGGDAALVAAGQRGGKAALSLLGNDGVTYRLLRELGGAGGLHRLNPETQKPELVTQDAAELVQVLRARAGAPSRATFEQLYCLRSAQLPSKKPRRPSLQSLPRTGPRMSQTGLPSIGEGGGLGPRASQTGMPSIGEGGGWGTRVSQIGMPSVGEGGVGPPVMPAANVPAALARVKVLETELALAREVEALQFEADGVNAQLFEAEQRIASLDALRARTEAARAEADARPGPRALGLPDDLLARAERYPAALARRDEGLAKVQAEKEDVQASAPSPVSPLWKERAFWLWMAGGTLALGLGLVLDGVGQYVALLDVPLFGMAAVMALRYVDELKQFARQSSKSGRGTAREKKILEDFEQEMGPVIRALGALEVDDPKELAAALQERKLLADRVSQLRAELAVLEADPEVAGAPALLAELRAQAATLSARIEEKGAYTRDVREVERELLRTRESIDLALRPAASPAAGAGAVDALEDPTPALLALAAELLGLELTAAMATLHPRCLQYFTALTDRRYPQVEWDREGRAQVLLAGRKLALGELPGRDVDLYAIALRLTVLERVSARVKVPFLVEDVFTGLLDEVKLPLVARMLKHLGTLTQVVHATGHPGFTQVADASLSV